ncbi:LON peptidase N-terminal domain and RING finger protein 1 [Choanephora cucurbitarum]|uniref:LON peptidase N-terminal domain and RING finger protein 1 n=1 Tax=Choanephora cucurbitarum TaxID=101091 RepID=A0A1C7NFW3_9FUNG|nr:LON peptidase N-terminal domain and RING finger protein 1 [Choanephora cucurbitarum]
MHLKRSRDQAEVLPVGQPTKKQRHQLDAFSPSVVIEAFTRCPSCHGKLTKPTTLPCGYTACHACVTSSRQQCISPSCDRQHTLASQPSVTIQALQAIVVSAEASRSLDTLRLTLDSSTECPICCTRFNNPTTTPCGHTFCRNCLMRSLDHQRSCPFCRDNLDFCPPPAKVLCDILSQLYADDAEVDEDALAVLDQETRVPLLIGNLAFPHVKCAIHVFEPRYRLMLRRIMQSNRRRFAMCMARRNRTEGQAPFYEYGTMLELTHVQTLPDGRSLVEAVGSHRFKVIDYELTDGYHMASIERIDDIDREQENMLEQQQILRASASRARSQQSANTVPPSPAPVRPMPAAIARPASMVARPASMVARPASMVARPASMVARPASMVARPMPQQTRPPMESNTTRQSWAQRAHPQTQAPVSRAPWLQMHVQGLSAQRSKPQQQQQQQQQQQVPSIPIIPEKIIKNRQEQSTEEMIDELATFVEKLIVHKNANPNDNMSTWLSALGHPPALRGPQRDRVILTWWVINMMPLSEDEKVSLIAMRTLRERVLLMVSRIDRFEDQWSVFLNNPSTQSSTQPTTCCIS